MPTVGLFISFRFVVLIFNQGVASMSSLVPSYIRIKRPKQTIFLHCDLNETVQAVKERIEKLTGQPANMQRLLFGKQLLEPYTSLMDCGIEKEDAEVILLYNIGQNGEEQWEEPVDEKALEEQAAAAEKKP